ncbi:MAG: hypothetical protein HY788_14005 [Deltaproteobacteria bacterium]|nr:hypothetical protein [Deltaproteobacteria bacterium]
MYLRVLYVVLIAFLAGCSIGREAVDPKIFAGTWETTAAKYADRFIDIRRNSIAFGTGGQDFQSYTITGMVLDSSAGRPHYTIYYKDGSGDGYEVSFYFDAKSKVIRLKHQEQIEWKRRSRS